MWSGKATLSQLLHASLEISTIMSIFTNTLTKKEMHKAKAASRTIQKPLLQITDEIRQEFIKKGNCNNYPSVDCESGLAWFTCFLLSFGVPSSNSLSFKSLPSLAAGLYRVHSSKFLLGIPPHLLKCGNHSLYLSVCIQHIYSSYLEFACQLS